MGNVKFILFSFFLSAQSYGVTFNQAVEKIEKHEMIESIFSKSRATSEEASFKGSWGDPHVKVAAKNFPEKNLKDNQTPMTGIEFSLSQKVSLTTKYGNIKDSYQSLAKSYEYDAKDKKQALRKALWNILIEKRRVSDELKILSENRTWIDKILRVSKKLYTNGKTSQQALLDLQIRKSELESEISNKGYELSQIEDQLKYLVGDSKITENSIPWELLDQKTDVAVDNKEISLQEKMKAKDLKLTASKLNYIPDLTVSVGYTKRANIDGNGDFVGASVSFPLPFSGQKYANHEKAIQEKYTAVKDYENYKRSKLRDKSLLEKEINKLKSEIKILKDKTIKFAKNSREITAKSYALGNSSYVELLQSELKLQKILIQKVMLEAMRDMKKISLKYVLGEPLK